MSEAVAGPGEKTLQMAWDSESDDSNGGIASWNFFLPRRVTVKKRKNATSNTVANEIGEGVLSKHVWLSLGSEPIHGTGTHGHGVELQRGSEKRRKWPNKSASVPSRSRNAKWSSRFCTGTRRFKTPRRSGYGRRSCRWWNSSRFLAFSAWRPSLLGVLLLD